MKGSIEESPVSRRHAYYIVSLLFLLYMFDYIDRLVVVSLFPFIQRDWGLSDTQCGMLVSAVYWSILIFTLPVSVLIDRWSRKKSIGLMALFWSLATVTCAITKSFGQLFVTRAAIGIGEAGYAPGGTAMISGLFSHKERARILGLWNASIPLGSALGIILGGVIAEHFGWRHAFGIVALPGLILAILFFYVKDYKTIDLVKSTRETDLVKQVKMSRSDIIRQFTRNRTLILNNLAFANCTFVTTALLSWLPTYFFRTQEMSMTQSSTKAGSIMFLAILGAPLGGYLADKWYQKKIRARLFFPGLTSLITALILFVALKFFQGTSQYLVFLLVGICAVAFVPAAVAVTQDVVHPGLRATSLSLNVVIQHLLGSALGPIFVGILSDRFDIGTALSFLPLFLCLAAVLFISGSFFYESDFNKAEKVAIKIED